MPDITYILRFIHIDNTEIDEVEHRNENEAREHLNLFSSNDADTYARIDLISYDWKSKVETRISTMLLI